MHPTGDATADNPRCYADVRSRIWVSASVLRDNASRDHAVPNGMEPNGHGHTADAPSAPATTPKNRRADRRSPRPKHSQGRAADHKRDKPAPAVVLPRNRMHTDAWRTRSSS